MAASAGDEVRNAASVVLGIKFLENPRRGALSALNDPNPRESVLARVEGVDPKRTGFMMRYGFKNVRKAIGQDLTPQKIAARVPRVFWVTALTEWLIGEKTKVRQRLMALVLLRDGSAGRVPVLN